MFTCHVPLWHAAVTATNSTSLLRQSHARQRGRIRIQGGHYRHSASGKLSNITNGALRQRSCPKEASCLQILSPQSIHPRNSQSFIMPDIDSETRISVLDLPQLHSKPSTATLLRILSQLSICPSSFDGSRIEPSLQIDEAGITGYLTRFIASQLAWIPSDEEREEIWEAASQRLSERSGRMAMSTISRRFSICDYGVRRDGTPPRYISVQINEPSMTEDKVGHKTWTGSFLLAQRLPTMMATHFPALLPSSMLPKSPVTALEGSKPADTQSCHLVCAAHLLPSPPPSPLTKSSIPCENSTDFPRNQTIKPVKVLELGSGTGLTGLAAAALFTNISVHVTDLPSIIPNLVANIETNSHLFTRVPTSGSLDWSKLPSHVAPDERYDCILAADSLYDPQHPNWLTNTMALFLNRQEDARILVELPFRDMDLPYHDLLRDEMERKGFVLLDEGSESGYDDWEKVWGQKVTVRCWWSVWAWAETELEQTEESLEVSAKPEDDSSHPPQEAKETAIPTSSSAEPKTNEEQSSIG